MSKKLSNQFLCSRMMLPEHREKLKLYQNKREYEENYRIPQYSDQQLEEFQFLLDRSLKFGLRIELTILTDHGFTNIKGVVKKTEAASGQILVTTREEEIRLEIKNIVGLKEI